MHVNKNEKGFTLLEFVVAVFILMVGLLGLLQSVNLGISTNMVNQLRTTGVVTADQLLSDRIARIDRSIACAAFTSNTSVRVKVLNAYKNYSATIDTTCPSQPVSPNTYKVDVRLRWKYKNMQYNHDASSVVAR